MKQYTTNFKNRKFKNDFFRFLSRISFWASKLPLSGRVILLMNIVLFFSLFFPWFTLKFSDRWSEVYWAFSSYTGYLGYGLLLSIALMLFFLLSHTKKEQMRKQVPFRLSDTQAIVWVSGIFLALLFHMLFIFRVYNQQIATAWLTIQSGFYIAFVSFLFITIASYYLSQSSKKENTDMYYIDNQNDDELQEYSDIIYGKNQRKKEKNNMSLPI